MMNERPAESESTNRGHVQLEMAEFVRHEGSAVAKAAAQQAARASRAVRADPLPTIVGVVGLALLASLVFGRRRS